jgi:hypothetical protein
MWHSSIQDKNFLQDFLSEFSSTMAKIELRYLTQDTRCIFTIYSALCRLQKEIYFRGINLEE